MFSIDFKPPQNYPTPNEPQVTPQLTWSNPNFLPKWLGKSRINSLTDLVIPNYLPN